MVPVPGTPKLRLSPHFERVPTSSRHAYLRSAPDRLFSLTDDTFALLGAFVHDGCAFEEALPGASAEQRQAIATLIELGVLLREQDQVPPWGWELPAVPLFGLPLWPRRPRGERCPIVALGARYDDATLPVYPRGARGGPQALRRAAQLMSMATVRDGRLAGLPSLAHGGEALLAGAVMADGGDLVAEPGCSSVDYFGALETRMTNLAAEAKLLLVGGDHSLSLPALRALSTRHRSFGVLHFDAHSDLGAKGPATPLTHANVMGHVAGLDAVQRLVQVGLRGVQSVPPASPSYQRFTPEQLRDELEVIDGIVDPGLPWYVSVDIDVLDPTVAPATAAPEPGGLSLAQLCAALRRLTRGRQVIGADLVEIQDLPGDRLTARVGAYIAIELASAMDRR